MVDQSIAPASATKRPNLFCLGPWYGSPKAATQVAAFALVAFALIAAFAGFTPRPAAAQAPVTDRSTTTPPAARAASAATGAATSTAPSSPATNPPVAKSFVSLGERPAVLFDAPSNRANKLFILNRLSPLEVLVKLEKMTKVRDAEGAIGWVENTALGERRHVQVASVTAEVRASASTTAALVFEAQRAVLLEVNGNATADGWLPVKHRDGQAGFVRTSQIWGD